MCSRETQRPLDAVDRDRERRAGDVDLQRGDDRQRQRQADLGGRALPELESINTSPPSSRIFARTASIPTPRPEMSLVVSAVEKPGANSSSIAPCMSMRFGGLGVDQAALDGLAGDRLGSMPRPSSRTSMTTLPPAWRAAIVERAGPRLAGGDALVRRLEAVVERVADEVDERIAERVDDGAVELGVAADQLELDLLAELGREVADQAREAHEDDVDRDHPDLHDHRLQRLRAAGQVLDRVLQLRRARCSAVSASTAVRWMTSSPIRVHQRVEALGVDADGASWRRLPAAAAARRARAPRRRPLARRRGARRGASIGAAAASAAVGRRRRRPPEAAR